MASKILLVDDDPNILKLLDISLSKAGFDILACDNAEDGIKSADRWLPDLIISDISMPEMDGLEFCWMIREKSKIPLVPFIFLTSLKNPDLEVRGFRAGADDFLNKPIDREELIKHVNTLLTRNKKLKSLDSENTKAVKKGISGDLSELSLVEIIQLLHINKRSGKLVLDQAEIIFLNGAIIKAVYGAFKNEQAIFQLVRQRSGSFHFENLDIADKAEIKISTMNLVMEACQRLDEGT